MALFNLNEWLDIAKFPTFCHKFPRFFLLFSYFGIFEVPTFVLLFHMKSLESLHFGKISLLKEANRKSQNLCTIVT